MTKRNIEIKVRLSRKEAENLNKQVKKCRLSREAYLRHLITGEVPREAPPPEYFAFMREMHYVGHNLIFPKGRPQNRARLHFLLREDLLKLNNISQEVRLLARHQIDTAEQLALYKKEQEVNIRELSAKRRVLQNALRTKAVRDSPKQADAHRAQIRELSERLKALRREVHLCDDIAERSGVMAEKLKAVREDAQKQRQKEEQQHEHIRRRS